MSPLLEEIERFTLTGTPYPSMLTGRVEGRFLQLVVQLSGARNIVDIGTFTGYSALAMAEALPQDGRIITIEHNPEHARIAQDFFNRHASRDRITLRRTMPWKFSRPYRTGRPTWSSSMPTSATTTHTTKKPCGFCATTA